MNEMDGSPEIRPFLHSSFSFYNLRDKNKMENEYKGYTAESVKERPKLIEAKITKVETKLAKEIFVNKEGEVKADKPEEEIIQVTLENEEHNFSATYNLKKYPADNVPEASQLGKFLKKVGGLNVGFEVDVLKNSKGYYDLVLN